MPLYVLIQLVPGLAPQPTQVDLATIGLFSVVLGLPYTWKFVWSPVMDRFSLPFLGRRRGWALVTQDGIADRDRGCSGHFDPD